MTSRRPRILCVCLGNICRSPTAEGVLRHRLGDAAEIDSAGTSGWHEGDPPYGPMQGAAMARGYDLSDQRARRFTPADFDRFDLILAMDGDNLAEIEAQRPAGHGTPVRLFLSYAPDTGVRDVPDPYHTRDFDGALTLVEAGADAIAQALREGRLLA